MAAKSSGENPNSEFIGIVRAYAQQETIDPIKGLARYLLFGVIGSIVLGIGVILLTVALLRVLQTETGDAFDGNWSWVPYVIALVALGLVIAVTVRAISQDPRDHRDEPGANQ